MPGFPREEQQLVASLVGAHRRKIALLAAVEELVPPWHVRVLYLAIILRLSVVLHRGRSRIALPSPRLTAKGRSLEIRFPRGWLTDHPLTRADLELEVDYLRATGIRLDFC